MFLFVLGDLFDAKVRYANTRAQPLINSAVVRHEAVRTYLMRIHPSLKVESRRSESAKSEMHRIRGELQRILDDGNRIQAPTETLSDRTDTTKDRVSRDVLRSIPTEERILEQALLNFAYDGREQSVSTQSTATGTSHSVPLVNVNGITKSTLSEHGKSI